MRCVSERVCVRACVVPHDFRNPFVHVYFLVVVPNYTCPVSWCFTSVLEPGCPAFSLFCVLNSSSHIVAVCTFA